MTPLELFHPSPSSQPSGVQYAQDVLKRVLAVDESVLSTKDKKLFEALVEHAPSYTGLLNLVWSLERCPQERLKELAQYYWTNLMVPGAS
jgi:hypothetical protein